jgi:ubiquitin-activating enzyme E1
LTEEDIGKNRAEQSIHNLSVLNEYSDIQFYSGELTENYLKQYSVVIFTDHSISHLVEYNEICRRNNVKFIATELRGLFGSVFVDFGDSFEVTDVDGEAPSNGIVVNIDCNDDGIGIVDTKDPDNVKPHDLNDGDTVFFKGVNGMTELNGREFTIKRVDAFRFEIGSVEKFTAYAGGGHFYQVKKPIKKNFAPLATALKEPVCDMFYDYAKMEHPHMLHHAMIALGNFQTKYNRLPAARNEADALLLVEIAKEHNSDLSETEVSLLKGLAYTARGQISPMAAFLGGLVAQEAQKATTGKFTPIPQWFHFESLQCLPKEAPEEQDCQPEGSRYDGQIVVFGKKFQKKIANQKVFLVGAGALGCEFLKNFAMMGVACGPRGKLIVTDLDNIENSNLSRQFLFRKEHIGKMKSAVGAEAAKKMNAHINVEALQDRVGPETENVFNEKFWNSLDFVTNALDNVEARKYVDSRCIFFRKPLLESGTLGTKANVQVIVPDLTESYGSQSDPDQGVFPECTIHYFPNVIQHTITWAKSVFKSAFQDNVELVNEFLVDPKGFLSGDKGNNIVSLETVNDYVVRQRPHTFADCVAWARLRFEEQFNWAIRNIVATYPEDRITKSGGSYWSGNKRFPSPIEFNPEDPSHIMYIEAAAIIYGNVFGIECNYNVELKTLAQQVKVPVYIPNPIADQEMDESNKKQVELKPLTDEEIQRRDRYLESLRNNLVNAMDIDGVALVPIEFEKDSETNFHVDFMTACSNLRARSYKIPEADKWETKGIAGNIIPAMITTTALVTGLVMLELYKVVDEKQLEEYRNAYLNIAIPFITMSEPVPPRKEIAGRFTVWDTIEVNEGKDITLKEFVDMVGQNTGFPVMSVTYYGIVLYTFFQKQETLEKRSSLPLAKLIEVLTKEKFAKNESVISLQVLVVDFNAQDEEGKKPFNLPRVKYHFRAKAANPKDLALAKKKKLLAAKRKREEQEQ